MPPDSQTGAEATRLTDARDAGVRWRKWGPYPSERQWGTVREDYSANGDALSYFSHDQARSRVLERGKASAAVAQAEVSGMTGQ